MSSPQLGPPRIDNLEEAREAAKILARPPGVRRELETPDKPVYREEIEPAPVELDSELTWFFPCLLYCMVGLDRSVFDLWGSAEGCTPEVVTYQASSPVVTFPGQPYTSEKWFYIVQGVPPDTARSVLEYIESFRFDHESRGLSWVVQAESHRLADPFSNGTTRRGVDMTLLLPGCVNTRRYVSVVKPAGLGLSPIELGVKQGD